MSGLRADPDSSEEPQPGKAKTEFRNYTEGKLLDRVYNTYLLMHTHQTVEFVRRKSAQYGSCSLRRMSAMEALQLLDQLVDESDPDVDFPNSFHAFQTAEGIRRAHPDKDWFHLVGLLHDLGKVLVLFGEPQWAVVGDTFPVGCRVQKSVVYGDSTFHDNPDTKDPRYRVHVPSDEVQQLRPAQGGLLHGSLPLLLPLARPRRLRPPVLGGGPAHAALGPRAQQVRPVHQAGGAARRAAAPRVLPGPHRQILPGAALLVTPKSCRDPQNPAGTPKTLPGPPKPCRDPAAPPGPAINPLLQHPRAGPSPRGYPCPGQDPPNPGEWRGWNVQGFN
ncbi:inositol oxygenase isoform X1 [Taeniopygia guttata]